jgi:hypothetical protein
MSHYGYIGIKPARRNGPRESSKLNQDIEELDNILASLAADITAARVALPASTSNMETLIVSGNESIEDLIDTVLRRSLA